MSLAVFDRREDSAPRIDQHRMAPRLVVRLRLPNLACGDHERRVLDRAGAQQDFPMGAAGHGREGGRNREGAGAAQGEDAKELGEAKVITDSEAQLELARGRGDEIVTRTLVLGLPVLGALDLYVEHVKLAIGRDDLAARIDENRRVEGLVAVARVLGEAAG